jgi:hypothetical protein
LDQADEVILVDNGSVNSEVSVKGRRLGVRVVPAATNLGFAAGANLGLRRAQGDIVGLLNDDAMSEPGWLQDSATLLSDESIAAVAPKTIFADPHARLRFPDEPHWATGDPRPLGRCLHRVTLEGEDALPSLIGPGIHALECGRQRTGPATWRWTSGPEAVFVPLPDGADPSTLLVDGDPAPVIGIATVINNAGSYLSAEGFGGDYGFGAPDDGTFDEPGDPFAASGVAMVIRRETLLRLGYFGPRFFAYYEDIDWCWRARLCGMRIHYGPGGVVRHIGGVTSGGPRAAFVRFLAARNRILTLGRNAPIEVLLRQLAGVVGQKHEPHLGRSLAKRLPEAMIHRRELGRLWQRSPAELWHEWAGVGETRRPAPPQPVKHSPRPD